MKYLYLYEAFDSDAISKVVKYVSKRVGKKHSKKFVIGLKSILKNYDYPIDKISDNDVEYLSAKKALLINSDNEVSNDKGVFCLKFWFSLEDGFIGYTGVGDKKMDDFIMWQSNDNTKRNVMTSEIVSYIKNTLNIKTGTLTKIVDYYDLKHGDDIIGCFNSSLSFDSFSKGKIYIEQNSIYAIQDVSSGSSPPNNDWRNWGSDSSIGIPNWLVGNHRYSWSLGNPGSINDDHSLVYKYTEGAYPLIISDFDNKPEEKIDSPFIFNLPLSGRGRLTNWSKYKDEHTSLYNKNWKDIENADFSVVIYLDKMLDAGFKKSSETNNDRIVNRLGALKLMSDNDIKNDNIKRYIGILVSKMGINVKSIDLKNLQKFISTTILGDYSYFSINSNRPEFGTYVEQFYKSILTLMVSIKDEDSEERIKRNFNKVIIRYEDSNERSSFYKNKISKNYQTYIDIPEKGKQFDLLNEYLKICKYLGSYIKDYLLKQEINSIEEYIFLCSKVESIRKVMINNLFKPESTPIRHCLDKMFSNSSSPTGVIDYMNNDSNIDDIDIMKNDLERLKNIEKYIKSILN
jgi:hypothetical protein